TTSTVLPATCQAPSSPLAGRLWIAPVKSPSSSPGGGPPGGGGGAPTPTLTSICCASTEPSFCSVPSTLTTAPTPIVPFSWSNSVDASACTFLPAIVQFPINPVPGIACTAPVNWTSLSPISPSAKATVEPKHVRNAIPTAPAACHMRVNMISSLGKPIAGRRCRRRDELVRQTEPAGNCSRKTCQCQYDNGINTHK